MELRGHAPTLRNFIVRDGSVESARSGQLGPSTRSSGGSVRRLLGSAPWRTPCATTSGLAGLQPVHARLDGIDHRAGSEETPGWDAGGERFRQVARLAKFRPSRASGKTSRIPWVKMVSVNEDRPVSASLDVADEGARVAAIARLRDLFSDGTLSFERFSGVLDQVFAAPSHADLEAAMVALPPLVRLTPASRRLARPLVLQVADGGGLQLGSGWQLAADTTVGTGFGTARLDLTVASWDAHQIDLRLETWGSIEVLVPEGVVVLMAGGSRPVQFEALSPPVPGGPVLRISTSGPTGVIRIRHPEEHHGGPFRRWRRRRTAGRPSSGVRPSHSEHRP